MLGRDILSQGSSKPPHAVNTARECVVQPDVQLLHRSASSPASETHPQTTHYGNPTAAALSASTLAICRAVIQPRGFTQSAVAVSGKI